MRDYKIDNLKFFLIFCVVFGHMFEVFGKGGIYLVIYSFHMPAFIFVSGYFARFDARKIVSSLIYPYFLFQTIYIVFDAFINHKGIGGLEFQYTTPYWLLWYLLAMTFYYLLIPFMESMDYKLLMALACVISLIAGFDQSMGYYLSLSRFFTFLPYFVLGIGWKHWKLDSLLENRAFRVINIIFVLITCVIIGKYKFITDSMLYGSRSYVAADYNILIKALLLLCGINWIMLFMWVFPRIKIPLVSCVGENTLVIFLAHGFIKKLMERLGGIFVYSRVVNIGLAVLISLIIVFIFGNKYIGALGRYVCTGEWIGKVMSRIRRKISG